MSAVVCGKRSYFHLEERLSPSDVVASKRCRRFLSSPPDSPPPWSSPPDTRRSRLLTRLLELFPDMEKTVIERVFDEYGDDIDAAINKLKELHIETAEGNVGPIGGNPNTGTHEFRQPHLDGLVDQKSEATAFTPQTNDVPSDGSGWLDLFVAELSQASSIDDLRGRTSRALATLEQSITARVVAETGKDLQKENMVLKEQVGNLLRDKHILKRAVAIQHERQREYNDKIQDFEQLINQYKEQVRLLEINNYALNMHLKQAQSGSSIPGRFHPDVF